MKESLSNIAPKADARQGAAGSRQADARQGGSHAFSIILIMVVLMLIGAALLPRLNIQYDPKQTTQSISVSFGYSGASARVVESEVTSKIEGALNSIEGVSSTRATSNSGGGYISLEFKKGTDMETARYEVATRLRQIRSKLPEGVNPSVSGSVSGKAGNTTLLNYTINADMPPAEIVKYAEDHILTPLSRIEGVESVTTSGAMPFEWVLTFDPGSLKAVGLSPSDLSSALSRYFDNSIVGTELVGDKLMLLRLKSKDLKGQLEQIPIGMVNDRLYYMGDFATVTYEEQEPQSYSRINGLNTIDINVTGMEGINTIEVAKAVKDEMNRLKQDFPERFAVELSYDASVSLENEIEKIFFRAVMSLAILLLFVLLVSRSLRYLLVIGLTICVNLLTAVIFYNLLGVDIEIYSMAGITVSLGIIIDTAIVIADHYTYYGNRKVMTSISGALLTTIAALLIIFFLPESSRRNLTDFVWVIIINLTLSMIVAFLFVPALLEKMPLKNKGVAKSNFSWKRRLVRWSARYERIILWGRCHRWVYIMATVLLFGIPIHLLPESVHRGEEANEENTKGGLVGLYNSTIGSRWYQRNKAWFEYPLGGAFNLFSKSNGGGYSYYREAEPKKELQVYANIAEGGTVQQLNEIVVEMENWLNQFDEIESYRTSLSGSSGRINISFKDEYEHSRFPYQLKEQMWSKACRYGGATWQINALDDDDQYLSNMVYRSYWGNTISLYGYNYDMLYRYAEQLIDSLKANRRVTDAGFAQDWGSYVDNEFYLDMDRERIAMNGLNVSGYISYLSDQLYDNSIGQVFDGKTNVPVRLVSAERDYYDLWHINNDMVDVDSIKTRLSDLGKLTKRRMGVNIQRENQEYVISVGYEFIGSYELKGRMQNETCKMMDKLMPVGFHTGSNNNWWSSAEKRQQALLLLVVVLVIYMICAILFESLRKPLAIVLMIPLGFIGLFLAFPIFGVNFDQGGFAAMVMLAGIVVNAGIYLTSEYNTVCRMTGRSGIRQYIKAFNRKIIPTLLTIVSTVLGLIPFFFDGKDQVFWYAFAIGVTGGMLFSIVALYLAMPVFFSLTPAKSTDTPASGIL